jgi:hypothetical protein
MLLESFNTVFVLSKLNFAKYPVAQIENKNGLTWALLGHKDGKARWLDQLCYYRY